MLKEMLQTAVPLEILKLQMCGGPTKEDMQEAEKWNKSASEKGDALLFRAPTTDRDKKLVTGMVKAVAILSFCPRGVDIFGIHFEAAKNLWYPESK